MTFVGEMIINVIIISIDFKVFKLNSVLNLILVEQVISHTNTITERIKILITSLIISLLKIVFAAIQFLQQCLKH